VNFRIYRISGFIEFPDLSLVVRPLPRASPAQDKVT